eukprot:g1427.t1
MYNGRSDREGWLIKANMSSHTKWRRRYFVLQGRSLLYFRSLPEHANVLPAGMLTITPTTTLRVSEERPRTFCLKFRENFELRATAPTAEDLAGWLGSLRAAVNVEIKISETAEHSNSDECEEEEEEETEERRRANGGGIGSDESKSSTKIVREFGEHKMEPNNSRWAILEPMKGLFSQLLDQYTSHGAEPARRNTSRMTEGTIGGVFGQPLRPDIAVPDIVRQCCRILTSEKNISTRGILRVSGQKAVVENLKKTLDDAAAGTTLDVKDVLARASESTPAFDLFNVGTLLKQFLQELPEPVIARICYPHLLRAQRMSSLRRKLAVMTAVVNDSMLLPPPHRRCLAYLLRFLRAVAKHGATNKMNPSNIAVCFAPTILQMPERNKGADASAVMAEICTTIETLKTMIVHVQLPIEDESEMEQKEECIGARKTTDAFDENEDLSWLDKPLVFRKVYPHRSEVKREMKVSSENKSSDTQVKMGPSRTPLTTKRASRRIQQRAVKLIVAAHRPRRQDCSTGPEIPLTRPYEAPTSSVLAVRAKGAIDQNPYVLHLNRDTKEFSVLRRTRHILAQDLECCVIDKTEESSESVPDGLITGHIVLLNVKPDQTIRIRVDTPAQALEWVTAINNVVELARVSNGSENDAAWKGSFSPVAVTSSSMRGNENGGSGDRRTSYDRFRVNCDVELDGTHIGSEVWVLDHRSTAWEKVYVELTCKALHWASVHGNPSASSIAGVPRTPEMTTKAAFEGRRVHWSRLRVGRLRVLGRRECYFTVGAAALAGHLKVKLPGCTSLRWRVEVRMSREDGALWHRMLLQLGESLPDSSSDGQNFQIVQRRRLSVPAAGFSGGARSTLVASCRAGNDSFLNVAESAKANALPFWTNDNESPVCLLCSAAFSLFLRRHHCRVCGRLVCDKCSQGRVKCKKGSFKADRACDRCVVSLFLDPPQAKASAAVSTSGSCHRNMSRKEQIKCETMNRLKEVLRARRGLVETARSYEAQISRQRRALARCREQYIDASERHAGRGESPCCQRRFTPAKLSSSADRALGASRHLLFTPVTSGRARSCSTGAARMAHSSGKKHLKNAVASPHRMRPTKLLQYR